MCLYLYTIKQKQKLKTEKMETTNFNPAEETKSISLTYMEARKLEEILESESKINAEIALDYLNSGDTRYAQLSAKKWHQIQLLLNKVNSII